VVIDLGPEPDRNDPLRQAVGRLLHRLQEVEIVGHHLSFDLVFLEHEFGWRPSRVWDTYIAEELLTNDDLERVPAEVRTLDKGFYVPKPLDLASVALRTIGMTIDKGLGGGGASDFGVDNLSSEQYAYAAGDVQNILAIANHQHGELTEAGMGRIEEIEMALVPVLAHAEFIGIPLRCETLDNTLEGLTKKLAVIDSEIPDAMRTVGFDPRLDYTGAEKGKRYLQPLKDKARINANGSALKRHFFKALEARLKIVLPRTERGNISITEDSLQSIDDPVAKLYLERIKIDALRSGIQQRRDLIIADSRVHPIHRQLSANTGRISTEQPAMSNVPKDGPLRAAVEAPPGYVLVQGDLSMIEVRAQAHFAPELTMALCFALPKEDPRSDVYRLFSAKIHKCEVAEVPEKGPMRNRAKPFILGKAYLMGTETFLDYARGYGVELSRAEAEELGREYFQTFPGIAKWHAQSKANAQHGVPKEGRSNLGRRRLILPASGSSNAASNLQYRRQQAQINYLIQSTCADGLKIGLTKIASRLPKEAELILSIHDEVLVLCKSEQTEEVGEIVTTSMIEAYTEAFGEPLKIPIVFEVKPLSNWGEK
jgi:DNA polymerase I-like protein with 3'-5' exonuclease and polymerase domains